MARYIDITKSALGGLLACESPARYAGGEVGRRAKRDAGLQCVFVFPDLYEIGMSNNALKIIYNRLNDIDDISCDRAFSPAPDFEKFLHEKDIPLYGLDTGIALCDADVILVTLSYELCATNLLAILESSKIPIHAAERDSSMPLIIAGGPCVSNPLPFAPFVDAFWIGEAEAGFFDVMSCLLKIKKAGGGRERMLSYCAAHRSVWIPGKEKAFRAVDTDFSNRPPYAPIFPLPNINVVQKHAAIEIMRGCPNGCRFCHAGIWYRPARLKSRAVIEEEVAAFVEAGFREISLSSLSSGDYEGIEKLIDSLNARFAHRKVSFQLPSLHVSTLNFGLFDKVSNVRKSGLTFAVETPYDESQISLNKKVPIEAVTELLLTAKQSGYKTAKFYFMIGLPSSPENEAGAICDFIGKLASNARMRFSVSVGVFVPKPHTPYQRAAQISENSARETLFTIRTTLKKQGHKVSVHDPFTAILEGCIARGDARAARIIEDAYRKGCRLDSWSEYFNEGVWREVILQNSGLAEEFTGARGEEAALPWECVASGVSRSFFERECEASVLREITAPCEKHCAHKCGVCADGLLPGGNPSHRMLFSYSKEGPAVLLSHLALVEVFRTALLRSGLPVLWTEGFNPMPKLDFAAPLSVGVKAFADIALTDMSLAVSEDIFIKKINENLPEGLAVTRAYAFIVPDGVKKISAPSVLWGYAYANGDKHDTVSAADDKAYRAARGGNLETLTRVNVFACNPADGEIRGYFDFFTDVYG